MADRPSLFPDLYKVCSIAALGAWLLIQLYYAFGAGGFAVDGVSFSFGRQHERQLYKIDDKRAFSASTSSVAVVKYGDGFPLFRLCGACVPKGSIFNLPRYRKGDWVYTDMPWLKGPAAYNLETEELVTLEVKAPGNSQIDPDDVPFYREHGFTFDKKARLDRFAIEQSYKPLSTVNEMCTILQMAGFSVLAIILLIGAVLLPIGLARRRAAARSAS